MPEPLDPPLAKVRADIAGLEGLEGESFWAESLGNDLYRLDNIPFYAYDVHYRDVVRAIPIEPDDIPTVVEVVQASGHKTLRVRFDADLPADEIRCLLEDLTAAQVQFEQSHGAFYALDVPPEADYQGICDLLWRLEAEGRLSYETGTTGPDDS